MVDLAKLRPDTAGIYKVIVYARDTATGKLASSTRQLFVKEHTGKELSLNVVTQTTNPDEGQEFKVYALAGGGVRYYRYSFSYIDSKGKRTVIKNNTNESSAVYNISKAGQYKVVVGVTDADGNYKEKNVCVNLCRKSVIPLTAEAQISANEILRGETLSVSMNANGGSEPYRYVFRYVKESGAMVTVSSGSENKSDISFSKSGYYTVKASVYDKNNECVEKQFAVAVTEDTQKQLSFSAYMPASKISVGEAVKVSASASGGKKPYQYSFRCCDEQGKTINLQDYATASSASLSFGKAGFYQVIASVKDYNGNVAEKVFNICAVKDTGKDFNAEIDSNDVVSEGSTVRFTVSASGGTEPYEYQYYYRDSYGQWIVFKPYGTENFADIKASEKGYLYVKADIRDGGGNVYSEDTNIIVYSKDKSTTLAQTTLQELPNWASKSLSEIPKGVKVNIITQYEHWFYVYYQGKVGWVYNRALGNYTNYYSVNTATLPYIADDIIFERGKDPFLLFRYVTGMAYRAMEKDSIENMCVELIKYKRGACYQRAAMVYYLYLRAGFDAIRVSDGIDDYTGGGPHNWVIVRTKDGYRHVDPTQVIGLPEFYMVTDNAISPYFSWDRNKYPACK